MEILRQLLEILRNFEKKVSETNYEQFTIDFVQNNETHINDIISIGELEGFGEYAERTESDLIGSLVYDVSCILDIIKDGKDKELFIELEKAIENL